MTYPHEDNTPLYDEVRERFALWRCFSCGANGVCRWGDQHKVENHHASSCGGTMEVTLC